MDHVDLVAYQREGEHDDIRLVRREMVIDAIVLRLGEHLILQTSAQGGDVLCEPVIEWPGFRSRHFRCGPSCRAAAPWRHAAPRQHRPTR
jgi:hypothetical protein